MGSAATAIVSVLPLPPVVPLDAAGLAPAAGLALVEVEPLEDELEVVDEVPLLDDDVVVEGALLMVPPPPQAARSEPKAAPAPESAATRRKVRRPKDIRESASPSSGS